MGRRLWVLEWSNEVDHKLYRLLLLEMLVALLGEGAEV